MSIRSHTVAVEVNLEEEVQKLPIYEQWEMLQILWDLVKKNGNKIDWEFFYKDNNIKDI